MQDGSKWMINVEPTYSFGHVRSLINEQEDVKLNYDIWSFEDKIPYAMNIMKC
jgi:hypothetical protein